MYQLVIFTFILFSLCSVGINKSPEISGNKLTTIWRSLFIFHSTFVSFKIHIKTSHLEYYSNKTQIFFYIPDVETRMSLQETFEKKMSLSDEIINQTIPCVKKWVSWCKEKERRNT